MIKCPKCNEELAIIHPIYGPTLGLKCLKESSRIGSFIRSNKYTEEYLATPFWKHMGKRAKPKEVAYEKEMKRRGYTYASLRKARIVAADKVGRAHDTTGLKKQLYEGKLKDTPSPNYGKQRITGVRT